MKNGKSLVRQKYDKFYKWLRLNGGIIQDENYPFGLNEIQECAILSYDYRDSIFHGWVNRKRFYKWDSNPRRLAYSGELPF